MKKIILSIVAIGALVVLPMNVKAQENANTNTTSHVRILSPISITNNTTLEFGVVARNAGAVGTLYVLGTSATVLEAYSGVVPLTTGQYATGVSAAKFTVEGNGGSTYSIVVNGGEHSDIEVGSESGITLDLIGATTEEGVPVSGTISGTLLNTPGENADGTDVFYIGGILSIGTAAVAGDFTSANIPVTVAYN